MRKNTTYYIVFIILFVAGAGAILWNSKKQNDSTPSVAINSITTASNTTPEQNAEQTAAQPEPEDETVPVISLPIDRAGKRITKKSFGTYVTPQNSPVQPEKFKGYHTGLDFETFSEEKDTDVIIKTICAGPLLQKRTASGYGGVAVQKCTINNETVTVIYGHIKLASIKASTNQELASGEALGVLGAGYSTETDGERKHLHLDIHKGAAINIAGYVQTQSALKDWLDPKTILGL